MEQKKQKKTTVCYARIANTGQRGKTLNEQRAAAQAKATGMGTAVETDFSDCGVKGPALKRPGLGNLLSYIAKGKVDYVIADNKNRFSFNPKTRTEVVQAIEQTGARVEFADAARMREKRNSPR